MVTYAQKSSTVSNLEINRRFACQVLLLSFLKNQSAHLFCKGVYLIQCSGLVTSWLDSVFSSVGGGLGIGVVSGSTVAVLDRSDRTVAPEGCFPIFWTQLMFYQVWVIVQRLQHCGELHNAFLKVTSRKDDSVFQCLGITAEFSKPGASLRARS